MSAPERTPGVDHALFRRVMGRFASGLTVITAQVGSAVRGMTASAFMSGSLEPPLLVVSVAHRAHMHDHLIAAGRFGVNILAEGQQDLANYFAGRLVESFEPEFVLVDGVPTLANACATMVADVTATYACGDHTLFVGHIHAMAADDRAPLIYHAGRFTSLSGERA